MYSVTYIGSLVLDVVGIMAVSGQVADIAQPVIDQPPVPIGIIALGTAPR
ncbi:MAG: hypothetical protein ACXVAY_12900 [Mucilaginibacter sp.]